MRKGTGEALLKGFGGLVGGVVLGGILVVAGALFLFGDIDDWGWGLIIAGVVVGIGLPVLGGMGAFSSLRRKNDDVP